MDENEKYKDDIIVRMMQKRFGSVPNEEIAKMMQNRQEAVDMAMGMMGTVSPGSKFSGISKMLGNEAPAVEAGLADRMKQVVANSRVKGPEGGLVTHNNPLTAAERAEAYGSVKGPDGGLTGSAAPKPASPIVEPPVSQPMVEPQSEYNPATDENLMRLKRLREMLSGS